MGVTGTFCQLCGLPVQHDHYVPSGEMTGMLKIYRGDAPNGGDWEENETPFRFGPEHEWLRDAVCLPDGGGPVLRGAVNDGFFQDARTDEQVMVWDGDEEGRAFHARCWEALGSPSEIQAAPTAVGSHSWALIQPYHEQLFAMLDFARDGKAWALVDPTGSSDEAARSRARIERFVAEAKRLRALPRKDMPRDVAEALAQDGRWIGRVIYGDEECRQLVHWRVDTAFPFDRSGYPEMVCYLQAYTPGPDGQPTAEDLAALEAFEIRLKAAVERDGTAIFVASIVGGPSPQAQLVLYARSEAEAQARIAAEVPRAIPSQPFEYDDEHDPDWDVFFQEMRLPSQ